MDAQALFEWELVRRGVEFRIDDEGDYALEVQGQRLHVQLDNLTRTVAMAIDEQYAVAEFVDAVLLSINPVDAEGSQLLWCLMPSAHSVGAYRYRVSDRVDRVLTLSHDEGRVLQLVVGSQLAGHSVVDASAAAYAALDMAVRGATIETDTTLGTGLAWLRSDFVAKASLPVAPALREVVAPAIGWPIHAVAPARDYLLMWNGDEQQITARLGPTVQREYRGSPYPLSAEVFEVGSTIRAIGEFEI